jgi:hypothetical protein
MQSPSRRACCALLATSVLTTGVARAELLLNGGFERGAFTPNAQGVQQIGIVGSPIEGWSTFVGDVFWVGTPNAYGIVASEGRLSMSLYDPTRPLVRVGSVSQTVATEVGAEYELSFDLGTADGFPRAVGIRLFANGQTADFLSAAAGSGMVWERFSWRFTARNTITAVQLTGLLGAGYPAYGLPGYIGLDQVLLERVAPVPEPAVGLMLALGLAVLRLSRRSGS